MDVLLLLLRIVLAVLLYAFLGTVLVILWRDLQQATAARQAACPGGRLVVVETAEEALATGDSFPLQALTSLGRSPLNTVCVPDTYASAHHALLTWREGQWWLEDRNSRNGTSLNDARIDGPTIVSAGDVIGVGRTRFKLEIT